MLYMLARGLFPAPSFNLGMGGMGALCRGGGRRAGGILLVRSLRIFKKGLGLDKVGLLTLVMDTSAGMSSISTATWPRLKRISPGSSCMVISGVIRISSAIVASAAEPEHWSRYISLCFMS